MKMGCDQSIPKRRLGADSVATALLTGSGFPSGTEGIASRRPCGPPQHEEMWCQSPTSLILRSLRSKRLEGRVAIQSDPEILFVFLFDVLHLRLELGRIGVEDL